MRRSVLPELSSPTISHTAEGVDAPARQNHPTGRKRSAWLAISSAGWHVRDEDAEFVFG
jgi:hypothetical protein